MDKLKKVLRREGDDAEKSKEKLGIMEVNIMAVSILLLIWLVLLCLFACLAPSKLLFNQVT